MNPSIFSHANFSVGVYYKFNICYFPQINNVFLSIKHEQAHPNVNYKMLFNSTTQSRLLMTQTRKPFENIVGNGENDGN